MTRRTFFGLSLAGLFAPMLAKLGLGKKARTEVCAIPKSRNIGFITTSTTFIGWRGVRWTKDTRGFKYWVSDDGREWRDVSKAEYEREMSALA